MKCKANKTKKRTKYANTHENKTFHHNKYACTHASTPSTWACQARDRVLGVFSCLHVYLLMCLRAHVRFPENLAWLVFFKHPLWDSPFALLPTNFMLLISSAYDEDTVIVTLWSVYPSLKNEGNCNARSQSKISVNVAVLKYFA